MRRDRTSPQAEASLVHLKLNMFSTNDHCSTNTVHLYCTRQFYCTVKGSSTALYCTLQGSHKCHHDSPGGLSKEGACKLQVVTVKNCLGMNS